MKADPGLGLRLFPALTAIDAEQVATRLTVSTLMPGEILFHQGDLATSAYLLVAGSIEIVSDSPQGGFHALATLEPGSVLGETALLLHTPRSATAVARSEATLCEMTHDVLAAGIDGGERWATNVLLTVGRELAKRIRATNEQLVSLIEAAHNGASSGQQPRVAELEILRQRLLADWSF